MVSRSESPDAEVDYLFLQVEWTGPRTLDGRTAATSSRGRPVRRRTPAPVTGRTGTPRYGSEWSIVVTTSLPLFPRLTGEFYTGPAEISGVPGTAAPVVIEFERETTPAAHRARPGPRRLHAGDRRGQRDADRADRRLLQVTGYERPRDLEEDLTLRDRLQRIRRRRAC